MFIFLTIHDVFNILSVGVRENFQNSRCAKINPRENFQISRSQGARK